MRKLSLCFREGYTCRPLATEAYHATGALRLEMGIIILSRQ